MFSHKCFKPDPKKVTSVAEFGASVHRRLTTIFVVYGNTLTKVNITFIKFISWAEAIPTESFCLDMGWKHTTYFDLKKIKIMLAPFMSYVNENKSVTLSVNATKYGIGSVLLQEEASVAFKLLFMVYGFEHFNYYT